MILPRGAGDLLSGRRRSARRLRQRGSVAIGEAAGRFPARPATGTAGASRRRSRRSSANASRDGSSSHGSIGSTLPNVPNSAGRATSTAAHGTCPAPKSSTSRRTPPNRAACSCRAAGRRLRRAVHRRADRCARSGSESDRAGHAAAAESLRLRRSGETVPGQHVNEMSRRIASAVRRRVIGASSATSSPLTTPGVATRALPRQVCGAILLFELERFGGERAAGPEIRAADASRRRVSGRMTGDVAARCSPGSGEAMGVIFMACEKRCRSSARLAEGFSGSPPPSVGRRTRRASRGARRARVGRRRRAGRFRHDDRS